MTLAPISIQLYSLRDHTKGDLPGVIQRLGQIGLVLCPRQYVSEVEHRAADARRREAE